MIKKSKKGRQADWTLDDLKNGFEEYYKLHKHFPTAHQVDAFEFLPSSRQIQRKFGGLVQLRKDLGLEGVLDYTKGEYSSERAIKINKRAHKVEEEVYKYLVGIFGIEFVHREYFFTDDRRTRTDFFIYCKDGDFSVDVFYPDNKKNLIGCLNNKMRTYCTKLMLSYPVIFLQMNDEITSEEIEDILKRKKNKLLKYQQMMNFDTFKTFCGSKVSKKGSR